MAKKTYPIKTESELRKAFWGAFPQWKEQYYKRNKRQNDYPCDVRCMWCDFIEVHRRNETISEKLAANAIL